MKVSGKTKVCAIIGDPVEHSLSPVIHNSAFKELGLNFVYIAFRVTKNELKNAISGARSLGLIGLNVTMPHKNTVIKYLDEVSNTAEAIGAVNTILGTQKKFVGFNTDGKGAIMALQRNNLDPEGKKMVLLGSGGAAKAISYYTAPLVKELVILNRTPQKAKKLVESLYKSFDTKIKGRFLSSTVLKEELETTDLLVNATSMGMNPESNESPVPLNLLRRDIGVMDIIYNPLNTKLLKDAKSVGAKVISGLDMLIYQGAVAFEIWTNYPAPVEVM